MLYFLLDIFANNPEDFILWIETLGMSLAQSWAVQDILVIIIRNNVSFLKASVRKIRYQLMEKFFRRADAADLRGTASVLRRVNLKSSTCTIVIVPPC